MSLNCDGTRIWGSSANGIAAGTLNNVGITIGCWVYPTNFSAQRIPICIADDGVGSTQMYALINTNGTVQFVIQGAAAGAESDTSVAALTANAWNLIAWGGNLRTSGVNLATIYDWVNGTQRTHNYTMADAGLTRALNYMALGGRVNGTTFSTFEFNGLIAHPFIYGSLLTQSDITSLLTTTPNLVQAASLLRYWPPDVAADSKSSGQTMSNREGTMDFSALAPLLGRQAVIAISEANATVALTSTYVPLQLKVVELIPGFAGKTGVDVRVWPTATAHANRGVEKDTLYSQTIDGAGTITLPVPNSVAAGALINSVGWIEVTNSNGLLTDTTGLIAAGPVQFKPGP